MSKLSSKALLGIALVLSLITTMLVYNYLKTVTAPTVKEGQPVVVAKTEITPRTKITPDMVQVTQVPPEYIQPGAMGDQSVVVGAVAREKIFAGEQITERRLVIESKSAGFSGIIPKDKRALTIGVTEVTGVAGFIKAGDYVDIIATFDQNMVGDHVSHVMLQNLLVLALNHDSEIGSELTAKDKKEPAKSMTVTLAVTPDEAARITLSEEKGRVRLALRPYMPQNGIAITTAVSPRDIMGEHAGLSKAAPPSSTPAAPSDGGHSKAPLAEGKGIITIRGTKMETVPIN